MTKNQAQIESLDKTPRSMHLYENYEVQEVIVAYTKDLTVSSLNTGLGTGSRLKEVSDGTLLLTPRNINDSINTKNGHDFANNATVEFFNEKTFQMETQTQDNLTPRLEEFRKLTQSKELRDSGKKVSFVVPILNDKGYHWYGAVVTFDPHANSENKYSYTFLDSMKTGAGNCPTNIKSKMQKVFGNEIAYNKETKGFYKQPMGSLSCGACLSANLMMNTGVIAGEHKRNVDIELRKEHFRMVPDMGWRNQPPTEAIADVLYLLESEEAKSELLDAAQNATRGDFMKVCNKWEKQLPQKKELLLKFRENAHKICFDSRYNRKGKINEDKLNKRLSKLREVENVAEKFVTCINSADIKGAQTFLVSMKAVDLQKMQQSNYYKENVNLNSLEGAAVNDIVNCYVKDKLNKTPDSTKSLVQSIKNLIKNVMNSLGISPDRQKNKTTNPTKQRINRTKKDTTIRGR